MAKRSTKSLKEQSIAPRRFTPEPETQSLALADGQQRISVVRQSGEWEAAPPLAPALQQVRDSIIAAADAALSPSARGQLRDFTIEVAFARPVGIEEPDVVAVTALVGAAVVVALSGKSRVELSGGGAITVLIVLSTKGRDSCQHLRVRELTSVQAIKEELEDLSELQLPRVEKPPHFVRLERAIDALRSLETLTFNDREQIAELLNAVLDHFSASLLVVGTSLVSNKVFAADEGSDGALKLRASGGTTRSLAAVPVEAIPSLSNRRKRK